MTPEKRKACALIANKGRQNILKATHAAGSGHPGGSLSAIDYLTYLYQVELRIDPKNPRDPNRDRFVLSKGHVAPALYTALAQRGYFDEEELLTLRKLNSSLQGHPNMNDTPGVDFSTGSLGQGVSGAVGIAKAAKYLKQDINVYTLLGDGEIAEGETWEAAEFAAHYQLDNLCLAVDVNGLQIDGKTVDVMNMEPIDKKYEAFGFHVIKVDGHDFDEIEKGLNFFHNNKGTGKPTAILLKTVKGKDVSFMENEAGWHGKAPNDEQFETAMKELLEKEHFLEAMA